MTTPNDSQQSQRRTRRHLANETNAILIVDADTVLALPIALQSFETIAWENCQIPQQMSGV
jgi:hypothetical protein